MAKNASMIVPFVNQGGKEAVIGMPGRSVPMVLLGDRIGTSTSKVKVTAPRLYARQTATPFKGRPFMETATVNAITNTTNATADVDDADAILFRSSDLVNFYDISASGLAAQALVINTVGAAGSGGAGQTLITFTGVFGTAPVTGDFLVVVDGTELSKNAVMVLEEIEYDGSTEFQTPGFIDGAYNKAEVENTARFDATKNSAIELIDMS